MQDYLRYRDLFRNEKMPLCFIDLDLLDKNIIDITKQMNDTEKTIRLASKSLRVPSMIKYTLQFKYMDGILAYSATEALFLSQNGINNIIIAYPIVNKNYIRDILLEKKDIYFMIDNTEHINIISSIAEDLKVIAKLCMDIDMTSRYPGVYFGVYRSSIKTISDVEKLGKYIMKSKNVVLDAVMGYEAQIAGVADNSPARNLIMNLIIKLLKKKSIKSIAKFRKKAVIILKSMGHPVRIINGGGTGSVSSTKREDIVTEVTVGSGFFSPVLFDYYDDFKYSPAMGFAVEITRIPEKGVYTCHGGGYIASGSVGIDKQPQLYLPKNAKLIADEGVGEVQTPFRYDGELQLGDPVIFRHAKAGELAEHFNEVILIRDGKIKERVKTYRGLGKNFL